MKVNFGTSFEYMRILQARTTDCLKLSSYFLRTVQNKRQKYLKTLTYQRLSRHIPFSTFNFMYKDCVYIKFYMKVICLCASTLLSHVFVWLFIYKQAGKKTCSNFCCILHTYCICILTFLAFSWIAECSQASFSHILSSTKECNAFI